MKPIQSEPVSAQVRCGNYPCQFRSERKPDWTRISTPYGMCPRCGRVVYSIETYNKIIRGLQTSATQGN